MKTKQLLDYKEDPRTQKEIALDLIREHGALQPKDLEAMTGMPGTSARGVLRDLEKGNMLKRLPGSHGRYDLPENVEREDVANARGNTDTKSPTESSGDGAQGRSPSIVSFPYYPEGVGAGPGRDNHSSRETMQVDTRLTPDLPSPERGFFTRVVGSSMEPYLSNGTVLACTYTDHVGPPDLYVFWFGQDDGELVKYLERTPRGLLMAGYGWKQGEEEYVHIEDDVYEDERGDKVRIVIKGRVIRALTSPMTSISVQRTVTSEMRKMLGN